MTEDFYDLLEISPDASQDEIKDAYREQVRIYHPDVNDDDRAQAQFTAVKTAYDILGDPVERQAYDRLGHEEYVAKRTSGLPSPDVWQSDDADDGSGQELNYTESEAASASASASASSATAGSASGGSRTASRSSTAGAASASAASGTAADASSATGTTTGTGTGTGSAGGTGSTTGGRTVGSTGETGRDTGRSSATKRDSPAGNPLVRWWRRQNFSLPLIWLSVVVYGIGLGQFALANEGAVETLWGDLRAIGADPSGLWSLLSAERHGVDTTVAFIADVEFVTPPLERTLWYGALAGVVALVILGLLVTRAVQGEETWRPVTIDETIVVALALLVTTTLVGGPLLAGAVLMPLLFGVVVRHTRRRPGWSPSSLYVLPVLAPLAAFGAATAGVASLPVDIAAVVVLPLLGGLGLPLRTTIRKHVGR